MGKIKALGLGLALMMVALAAFLGGCVPQTTETGTQDWTSILTSLLPLVLIFVLFYFVLIRPQRKREKERQNMIKELQKGDRVITAGGIYGVIDAITDDTIVIKLENGSMRVSRESVLGKRE